MKLRWIALFTVCSLTLVGCGGGEENTQVEMQQESESPQQQMETVQQEQTDQNDQQSEEQSNTQAQMDEAVPEETGAESQEPVESQDPEPQPGININTASSSQLQELTGVGPSTAESIVTYREENGEFSSIDQLGQVSGIGPATINKIRPDAKTSGQTMIASSVDAPPEESSNGSSESTVPAGDPININTASATALQELNGVGPATAEKIIQYRDSEGGFSSPSDIKNVSGIGSATFDKNKARIVTE